MIYRASQYIAISVAVVFTDAYGATENGYTDADGSSQEHRHAISGYVFLMMEELLPGPLRNKV
jgi:hypothetical protein